MLELQFKTKPLAHQLEVYNESKDARNFAYLMDMGTGKTKVDIDVTAYLYINGKINAALIVAPNGVQTNWVLDELPKHMSIPYKAAEYHGALKAEGKRKVEELFIEGDYLRILCINIESLVHKKSVDLMKRFLNTYTVKMTIDESQDIKNKNKRTEQAWELGRLARYRRIMTGSVITESPVDFYSQYKFLTTFILGYSTLTAFKCHFVKVMKTKFFKKEGHYTTVIGYKNIDELIELIKPYSYRVRKKDCLDLPDKVYEKRYFELSPKVRKAYDRMVEDAIYALQDADINTEDDLWMYLQEDGVIRSKSALTTLLKLQQISGNFIIDADKNIHEVAKKCDRLDAFMRNVEHIDSKIIIWARFTHEINMIINALGEKYGAESVVRYDGLVSKSDKVIAKTSFQENEEVKYFVAKSKSAGRGLTLTAASTMIYYSHSFSADERTQSEDRAHRIGQKNNVVYIDMIAQNTMDTRILASLKRKIKQSTEIQDQLI